MRDGLRQLIALLQDRRNEGGFRDGACAPLYYGMALLWKRYTVFPEVRTNRNVTVQNATQIIVLACTWCSFIHSWYGIRRTL